MGDGQPELLFRQCLHTDLVRQCMPQRGHYQAHDDPQISPAGDHFDQCLRRQHHRFVSVGVCLGTASSDQGGDQTAHAAGLARQNLHRHSHHRPQDARGHRAGRSNALTRCVLPDAPGQHTESFSPASKKQSLVGRFLCWVTKERREFRDVVVSECYVSGAKSRFKRSYLR